MPLAVPPFQVSPQESEDLPPTSLSCGSWANSLASLCLSFSSVKRERKALIKGQLGEELRRPRLGAHRSCYRCSGSLCISELCHEFNCHITQALTKRQLGPWQ